MDELKILIRLSDRLKGQDQEANFKKIMELEQIIRQNAEKDEENIKNILFPDVKNNNYFGVLKTRLYQELFNRILIDSGKKENINNRLNQLFDIQRKFIVASILNEKNERVLSIKMFEKTYKQAVKWEYPLYMMLISKTLFAHYAFFEPNRYKMLWLCSN
jgi:hypothetical protein